MKLIINNEDDIENQIKLAKTKVDMQFAILGHILKDRSGNLFNKMKAEEFYGNEFSDFINTSVWHAIDNILASKTYFTLGGIAKNMLFTNLSYENRFNYLRSLVGLAEIYENIDNILIAYRKINNGQYTETK